MGDPQTPATGLNVSPSASNTLPTKTLSTDESAVAPRPLRPAIAAVLSQLRRRIRGYVLLEGVALLFVVCGALFWSTFLIDWAYFRLTATELPRWFREAVAVSAITLVAAGLVFWIVLRYFAGSDRALWPSCSSDDFPNSARGSSRPSKWLRRAAVANRF